MVPIHRKAMTGKEMENWIFTIKITNDTKRFVLHQWTRDVKFR
jgi:hypothetical protein